MPLCCTYLQFLCPVGMVLGLCIIGGIIAGATVATGDTGA